MPVILHLSPNAALLNARSDHQDLSPRDGLATHSQQALSGRVHEYRTADLSTPQPLIRLMADEVNSGRLVHADREATGRFS